MTVRQLRQTLAECDDEMEVVFKPSGSMYGECVDRVSTSRKIASFFGEDFKAVVLFWEQVGRVK